ncbi:MAG: ArsR/SmtB family transcription factor [Thermoanaerobaculia bacterium]
MNVAPADESLSRIAAAIGEPARARMLCLLLDGHARTSTELAVAAGVSPSTASVHLARLSEQRLVEGMAQGKHRYYRLGGAEVAAAVEALMVVAGDARKPFVPRTPSRLISLRTCYDHMAGALAVSLHDRFLERAWLVPVSSGPNACDLTTEGAKALEASGIDIGAARQLRRRFAFGCVDWSERRPHTGGALGAGLLTAALRRKWVIPDLDSRALTVTPAGRREMKARFGLRE